MKIFVQTILNNSQCPFHNASIKLRIPPTRYTRRGETGRTSEIANQIQKVIKSKAAMEIVLSVLELRLKIYITISNLSGYYKVSFK